MFEDVLTAARQVSRSRIEGDLAPPGSILAAQMDANTAGLNDPQGAFR
jgi:hypothetical protein